MSLRDLKAFSDDCDHSLVISSEIAYCLQRSVLLSLCLAIVIIIVIIKGVAELS